MEITAAVFRKTGEPLEIEMLTMDDPTDREVRIKTAATGVCHSDYHLVDGSLRPPRNPMVLGHEGAGVVESVGAGVTTVAPGDHVVTCLSGFCGTCEQCLSGHPNVCTGGGTNRPRGSAPRLRQGDDKVNAFTGIGSFADHMLVHENSLVKIDPELPLDVAALVGCGVLTGVGAALRTGPVEAGQTVAVFGCGGVGLSVVQGAVLAGAVTIIAVDRFASKLDMARSLGATHVVDASDSDAVEKVREITGGRGVDHAFEAVGVPELVRQCAESLAVRGTVTIVGVPPDGSVFEIPYAAIRPECKVQTSRMGSNRFRSDIPTYLEFYRNGRLNLDDMISVRGELGDINEAFRAMQAGEVARTVLTF